MSASLLIEIDVSAIAGHLGDEKRVAEHPLLGPLRPIIVFPPSCIRLRPHVMRRQMTVARKG